jgi:TPR repeat protein
MWLNLAAAKGSKGASELREEVAKLMTPADVSKAQRLAREWMAEFEQKKPNSSKTASRKKAETQGSISGKYSQSQIVQQDHAEPPYLVKLRKAAEQGDANAQTDLALMYHSSDEQRVSQDYVKSAKWYRKAAEQGKVTKSRGKGVPSIRRVGTEK